MSENNLHNFSFLTSDLSLNLSIVDIEVNFNSFLDVLQSLFFALPLRNAARQRGNINNISAFFSLFKDNLGFHVLDRLKKLKRVLYQSSSSLILSILALSKT